jgi:glutamate dehydrogenase/leucine dehydrogenase
VAVTFQKLTSTDGFIAFDLPGAPAVGVVRVAPKVLRDGAELLARSTTYAAASFGLQIGGGSAGLNAKPDARDEAVAAFVGEVAELVESGRWIPGPGTGIGAEDLAPLPKADLRAAAFDPVAAGESAAAAAMGALGSLDGKTVAIVGKGPAAEAAAASVSQNGGTAAGDAGFDAECDALLVAGKAGALEHDLAATVRTKVVVPLTPVPVTARALAVLGRAGVVVVPDFLSTAGPLLAACDPDGGDPMERIHGAVSALAGEGTGMWMAAIAKAEAYLGTWQDALPFGRPLA